MVKRCDGACARCICGKRRYPPPVEQTDPAARRVAWVLWCFAAVFVLGLIAYALVGCAPHAVPAPLRAKPPAYGHRIAGR